MTPATHHHPEGAAAHEPSVLAMLRGLVPNRPLTLGEGYRIAELQANRLLRHFDVRTTAVPEEIVSDLPRVRIIREEGLAVSGAAYWNGRHWIIAVNADEPYVRQRFSIAHEFKHVLDHTTRFWTYHDRHGITAHEQAERVADYFAACLLMPKMTIKSHWFRGHQDIAQLARSLSVSTRALRFRLDQLGVTEPVGRCAGRPSARSTAVRRPYARRVPSPSAFVPIGETR